MSLWKGTRAWVDLHSEEVTYETVSEHEARRWGGMKGLAMPVLLEHLESSTEPLGPDNVFVLAAGLLNGVAFPGVCRYGAYARSPLTGGFGESEAGGYFGPGMKNQGIEAIVVTGRADRPVYLWVEEGAVEIRDAAALWGSENAQVQQGLRDSHGEVTVVSIGPAGEKCVRYACIINDLHHANGRTGMGAVMGCKNLKAVACPAPKPEPPAKPELFKACHESFRDWKENPLAWGLHENGTSAGVMALNLGGILPTRNFSEGVFDGAKAIDGKTMTERLLKDRIGCFACSVRCKRVVEGGAYDVDARYGGPEYETLGAFGSLCGVDDLDALCKAHERCNALGLDTISTGAGIAWAMECVEQGILTSEETGLDGFGDTRGMLAAIERIAARSAFGRVLADGVRSASQAVGKGSDRFAMHVKGQELPMHDPRGKVALSLAYGAAAAGADHMQFPHDSMFKQEGFPLETMKCLGVNDPFDPLTFDNEKLRGVASMWRYWTLFNHLGGCFFVFAPRSHFRASRLPQLVEAAMGWETSLYELLAMADRGLAAAKMLNRRLGIGPEEDRIPHRLTEAIPEGPSAGRRVDRAEFETALETLNTLMGWDSEGQPTEETLLRLGLEEYSLVDSGRCGGDGKAE
ncbi:MAG: aldehyde ferredoxin oxidoreductase family protein [Synergistales bacterium]|nr:aldehyde ferredoxin oxidoreductase family protein [Synergistales bacterium]